MCRLAPTSERRSRVRGRRLITLPLLLAMMVVGTTGAGAFNPTNAANYADSHWKECGPSPYNGVPPSPYKCISNDCTNYVSRALHAGGYSFVLNGPADSWYWYSSQSNSMSWTYADVLYGFLIYYDKDDNGRGGGTVVATQVGVSASQTYNSLSKGDLIFFDWENNGSIDHVRIETGWGTPSKTGYQSAYNNSYWATGDWADQHTEPRYHDMWNGYYQMTATQRANAKLYLVHIDPLNI